MCSRVTSTIGWRDELSSQWKVIKNKTKRLLLFDFIKMHNIQNPDLLEAHKKVVLYRMNTDKEKFTAFQQLQFSSALQFIARKMEEMEKIVDTAEKEFLASSQKK